MKLTPHCYAITGLYYLTPWNVNSGFIAGDHKTLVIDTGSSAVSAQTIYGYASAVRPDNGLLAINTEKHLDHIGGNGYFSDRNVPIYGHYLIDRAQEEFNRTVDDINPLIANISRKQNHEEQYAFGNTRIVNPENQLDREMTFDLGGVQANVLFTPGHTKTNLSVYAPREKVLYCGDLITDGFIPNLEEGGKKEWFEWLNSLELTKTLELEYVVPGHGNVITGQKDINSAINTIEAFLKKAIETGKAPTQE